MLATSRIHRTSRGLLGLSLCIILCPAPVIEAGPDFKKPVQRTPRPYLLNIETDMTGPRDLPRLVAPALNGAYYVLRTTDGGGEWPELYVDRFKSKGEPTDLIPSMLYAQKITGRKP